MSSASGKLLHQWEKPTVTVLATANVKRNAKAAPNNRSCSHICSLKNMVKQAPYTGLFVTNSVRQHFINNNDNYKNLHTWYAAILSSSDICIINECAIKTSHYFLELQYCENEIIKPSILEMK